MKKNALLIFGLSIFISTSLFLPVKASNQERGHISVSMSDYQEVAPDIADITFTIKTFDLKSIQKATLENKKNTDNVYKELQKIINPQNGDYIKTSSFNATPIYTYVNSKKVFDKYEVSNQIIVRTKSIDIIGKMIDSAILSGATNVENLSFTLSNYDGICDNLISNVTKKTKNRANTIAQALSTSITGISNISTSCNINNNNSPRFYMAKNATLDSISGSNTESFTTISNGVIRVNANVNATFFVND